MIVVLPTWRDSESTSPSWKTLSFIHSFVGLLSFAELIVKGVQLFFLFKNEAIKDFKYKNDNGVYYIK